MESLKRTYDRTWGMAEPLVNLFGPVDTYLGPYIEYVLLALLVVNIGGSEEY